MKMMHLSDLHLGKRLNDISLLPDQQYILDQITDLAVQQKPDCILIAGDIYDRSVPSEEAVSMLDGFLRGLSDAGFPILLISGNHDSAERVGFGSGFMRRSGIYVSPAYGNGAVQPVVLSDAFGEVNFYLLPFVRPYAVRAAFPDETIESYTDAVRTAIAHMNIDPAKRNVLVAHQFVAGSELGGSEDVMVGTLENVSASVFSCFDYTALGHIHRAQDLCGGRIRYSGTPLKYSFKEIRHEKTVTFITLGKKEDPPLIETAALHPLRDMCEKKGTFEELIHLEPSEDYIYAVLTDPAPVANAMSRLRVRFPNILAVDFPNAFAGQADEGTWSAAENAGSKSPQELLGEFFRKAGLTPDEETERYVTAMIEAAERKLHHSEEE